MCDSFVALGNSTKSGSVLLAKSADTEVNEAEHVVRYPARECRDGARLSASPIAPSRRRRERTR